MNRKFKFLKFAVVGLAGLAALSWVVMSLWNWLMPSLFFGSQQIGYLQAIGLLILCRILFGGFRGHGGWHRAHHHQRWQQMSEEERAKFRDGMMMFRGKSHE